MPLDKPPLEIIEEIVENLLAAYDKAPTYLTFVPFIPVLRLWLVEVQRLKDESTDGDSLS